MATASRLDALRDSFKEAHTAKSNLEDLLMERRRFRREKERMAEMEANTLKQIRELYTKTLESQKVVQHKTAQSQALLDSLENSVTGKKKQLSDIDDLMHNENEEMIKDVYSFEDLLSKLAVILVDAKSFYTEENLQSTIKAIQAEYEHLLTKSDRVDNKDALLTKYAESLALDVCPSDAGDGIDKATIWRLIEGDLEKKRGVLQNIPLQNIPLQNIPLQNLSMEDNQAN